MGDSKPSSYIRRKLEARKISGLPFNSKVPNTIFIRDVHTPGKGCNPEITTAKAKDKEHFSLDSESMDKKNSSLEDSSLKLDQFLVDELDEKDNFRESLKDYNILELDEDDKELTKKDFLKLPGSKLDNEIIENTKEADTLKDTIRHSITDRAMVDNHNWSIRMHQIGNHTFRGQGDADKLLRNKVFTGHEDVDRILNLPVSQLPKNSPLVYMWGCNRCFARGTPDCPYGIKDKETHANGYCDDALKGKLVQYTLMKTANGIKHLRNVNIIALQDMMQHYLAKLNLFKDFNKITKAEAYLMKQVLRLLDKLGERLDNAIKQEEGVLIKTEKKLTPADINDLLSMARNQEKTVEAEVIINDLKKEGDLDETVTS